MPCSGYMAPEYAFDGLFSTKSDVFSFGILLLEIISGKKSRGFYHPNNKHNLIGHVSIKLLDYLSRYVGQMNDNYDLLFRHGYCGMRAGLWNCLMNV